MNKNCCFNKVCVRVNDEECNTSCIRFLEMDALINQSNIPQIYRGQVNLVPDSVDVEEFEYLEKIKKNIVDFVSTGKSLFIYSATTGNAKTSWMCKLALCWFTKIWAGNGLRQRALFIHVPTFLFQIKENISHNNLNLDDIREQLRTVDLVLWDDIVLERMSEFEQAYLLTYIDYRVGAGLSNIYTGNAAEGQLKRILGDRLYSRVYCGDIVEFRGKDKR